MADLISLILHVSAAAILVGPQIVMFFAVTPATWFIESEALKRQVVGVIARRYGMFAGISLVVLLATGLYQFYSVTPAHIQDDMMAFRYGRIFVTKMTMFTALVLLIMVHAMVFAKRIRLLSDEVLAGRGSGDELERARQKSFGFSILLMLVSLAVLWLGVSLGHASYSYVEVG
ncbi:MAG: hypothetical protein O2924_00325 [Chloroflexi bacterium]|nr:hypothetical protein [Chloroflexota bacterium]MQC16660.1 hypothetical protein [Chloroflexota bacterium]